LKIAGLFSTAEVSDPGDGTLLLTFGPLDWRFVEVEPLYFHQVDGPFFMIFREDNQGHITSMSTDLIPQFALEKLDWYETLGFNMLLLLGCLLVFLSMIPIGLIRFIRNRRLSGDRNPASRGARVAQSIILGICVLNLLFVVGNVLWLNTPNLLSGTPLITKVVLGLGVAAALLSAGALVYTVLAWKNRYWGVASRLYYTLVTVAAVAFVWFLNYWNLLGWRY
jgi:hypothetical protein